MSAEITVILKDEKRTVRHKFLVYETFTIDESDTVLQTCLVEAKKNFNGPIDSAEIKVSMLVK